MPTILDWQVQIILNKRIQMKIIRKYVRTLGTVIPEPASENNGENDHDKK